MKKKKNPASEAPRLAWHVAFLQAIQLELYNYRDVLEFKYEHQLTVEPLRIDLLIIKKPERLAIDKNIAQIFLTDNLLEYKSPDDYLSVNDFLKVYALAHLYAAITSGVELSGITITLIGNRYPRKLLHYLVKTRGYKAEEKAQGIYQITGDYLPIQIIETKKLAESENRWLKSLTNDLEKGSMDGILREGVKWKGKMPMGAYFHVLARANPEIFLEVRKMATKTKKRRTFEEVFTEAGLIPEWMERGRAEGKIEIARNLLVEGATIEFVQKVTNLDTKTIQGLQN